MVDWVWLQPEGMDLWVSGLLITASLLTSLMTAAIGLGGGIALLAVMASVMPVAVTIPVHGVVQIGSNAGRMLIMLRHVDTGILVPFFIGSVIGGAAGSAVVINLPPELLQLGLGLFILWSIWGRLPAVSTGRFGVALSGTASTFLTMFFGATGVFVAAVIKAMRFDRLTHIASHAACMTLQHVIKVVAFGLLGFAFGEYLPLMVLMIVSGVLGTLLGRRILMQTADERFHQFLNILLTLLALRLLYQGAPALPWLLDAFAPATLPSRTIPI